MEEVSIHFDLYHPLGQFSRRRIDDVFLIFPRKQDVTLHANCLQRRQLTCNVKSCFLGKIRKKNISKCGQLKFFPRVLSVNASRENATVSWAEAGSKFFPLRVGRDMGMNIFEKCFRPLYMSRVT